jgi:hypothetical protein
MAKKSKVAKFRSKRKSKRANPAKAEAIETASSIGAGFAGYAATRLLSRMVYAQAVKRYPRASTHMHVAASALGATGVYFGSKHWSKIDQYHDAASIGAGIALIQTALQAYLPKFGWVVADVSADQYVKKEKRMLPDADMNSILPADHEMDALPEPSSNLGDAFDLDALLSSDNSIEAVAIGRAPATESNFNEQMLGDDYGDDPLEHYNGMLQ